MKVAYNACYGGFSLSSLALDLYAKKKGIELTWYKQTGYNHTGNESYTRLSETPDDGSYSNIPLKGDFGQIITTLPQNAYYYPDYERNDPDLIAVIEELGEDANGSCSALAIEEIPDGAEYEIDEYDGNESVVPPRQSW